MQPTTNYQDRPPRPNAFPGVCKCGTEVNRRNGYVWKGGVYCRYPSVPNVCPKAAPND